MKILVTGSAGFIGYHLSSSLLNDGHDIYGIDNLNEYYDKNLKYDRLKKLKSYSNYRFQNIDIADKKSLNQLFSSFNPQRVVNLAAQPGVQSSIKNPLLYVDSNILGFINIIDLCKNYNVDGFYYASSSSIYGANTKTPFNESDHVDKPLSFYGVTKRTNELIAHYYSYLYNLNTTGLRFFTVYGSWYRPDMALFIFIKGIIERKPIYVFNDGNIKRDFTFIDDIVEGTKSAIEKNYKCEIFNLGNSKSIKLMEIIDIIERVVGQKAKINFKPLLPGDIIETRADIKHSKDKIGFKPKTSVNIGIPKLIKWYKEYYNV